MQEKTKTSGTFRIEGMLQGPMPNDGGECQSKINAWMAAAKQKGLAFSLDGTGGQFSLLAENRTMRSSTLADGGGVSASLKVIFEKALECFPVQDRMGLFSTLRSIEYRPGSEVQSIYAVVPPGSIDFQERVLDADTAVPAPELTQQGKIKIALPIALLQFGEAPRLLCGGFSLPIFECPRQVDLAAHYLYRLI